MSSSSSTSPEFGDPYKLLGLKFDQNASEKDIETAFRKVSREKHPDKQVGKSEHERARIAKEYQKVMEAKEFLLNTKLRKAYDFERKSKSRRQEQDETRRKNMSERRRQMRNELQRKEAAVLKKEKSRRNDDDNDDEERIGNLRNENKRRRSEYTETKSREEYRELKKERKARELERKKRQIRFKWMRKKVTTPLTESSIATMLSNKFGIVISVEMIGSKGNAALVTFEAAASCQQCIEFYATHDTMRATPIIPVEEVKVEATSVCTNARDTETLASHRLRQAAERERVMRNIMNQDKIGMNDGSTKSNRTGNNNNFKVPFEFPKANSSTLNQLKTPLAKLQHFEQLVFCNILSDDSISSMKV